MIVKFTIENFRSIKGRQEIDFLVKNPGTHLPDNVAKIGEKEGVVRSLAVYGANASGKSTLIQAFAAMQWIAVASGDLKDGAAIPCYEPYLLSTQNQNNPVRLSLEFICRAKRYSYTVAFTRDQIVEELLEFVPSRNKATLVKRGESDTWESIYFGGLYKGRNRRVPFFKNNSYLSKAGNNADATDLMLDIYGYFLMNLSSYTNFHEKWGPNYEDEKLLELASAFLCNIDTGVTAIEKKQEDKEQDDESMPEFFSPKLKNKLLARKNTDYLFSHFMEDGEVTQFNRAIESLGTKKLFSMLPSIFEAFSRGQAFLIDEIESSFHPHVAELIVRLFNDPEANVNNAQLIFTTHSLALMSPKFMRRDQVVFVEKNDGETTVFSLNDYDKSMVKANSPFAEWYDDGRFGAVPSVNYGKLADLLKIYVGYEHHDRIAQEEDLNDG